MKALRFKDPWVRSAVERLLTLPPDTKQEIIDILRRSIQPEEGRPEKKLKA